MVNNKEETNQSGFCVSVLGFKSWRQFPTLLDENVVVVLFCFFGEKRFLCR